MMMIRTDRLPDATTLGQKRIFVVASGPVTESEKTIRHIVIFDNHPASLRLLLRTHLINREPVRCQRFVAAARREEGEYSRWIFDRRATPSRRQRSATLRAKLWPTSGCVAPQSQNASAMLLRRALPAARQSLAHRFPIYEMGSCSDLTRRWRNAVFYALLAIALVLAVGLGMFWPLLYVKSARPVRSSVL